MPKPVTMAQLTGDHPAMHTPCIWHPEAPREDYTVLLMRRTFSLPGKAAGVHFWISASQRYILFLNGKLISRGPSRSDPPRWGCVRVDVGELSPGQHTLAAMVFHLGASSGIGQMGGPGFFLLNGQAKKFDLGPLVNTGTAWRSCRDESRSPCGHAWGGRQPYFVVGAGERIDASKIVWGWEQPGFDDSAWPAAKVVCGEMYNEWGNIPAGHILRADPLPPMEERAEAFTRLAEATDGYEQPAQDWIAGRGDVQIPPNSEVRILVDRGELTNAYPVLVVSGGAGSRINMVSAEAGYGDNRNKTDRNVTAGKHIYGYRDEFLPDGGQRRTLTTLWFRSFRYVELTIETAGQALTLHRFTPVFSGYPLVERAKFTTQGESGISCKDIWQVTWRTARLCAHETFFDCPHYEQAQFPGDTRVQAVYHYLVANDDRLARKAIDDFHASRLEEGITQCRYPSRVVQIIPTFALYWVGMLHDFWLYRGDGDFLSRYMPFAREVLAWYGRHLRKDGLLGRIGHAPFMDWTKPFACGNAPQDADGGSSILTLLLACGCQWLADLEKACGYAELAPRWRKMSRGLVSATLKRCWDGRRQLLADTASKTSFSQHAQVQAILAGAWPPAKARDILTRAINDQSVTPPGTFYYRYYVAQAMRRCGLHAGFFDLLQRWQNILDATNLTTWPEGDVNPRSDCHAWSITPGIEFLQTILGIQPDPEHPGFEQAIFAPNLGPLQSAQGLIPTPKGDIRVKLNREGAKIRAHLKTPIPIHVPALRRKLARGVHDFLI